MKDGLCQSRSFAGIWYTLTWRYTKVYLFHMCQGLNSHYFHITGGGHQPNSKGLYTHYKDSLFFTFQIGMSLSPILRSLDLGPCNHNDSLAVGKGLLSKKDEVIDLCLDPAMYLGNQPATTFFWRMEDLFDGWNGWNGCFLKTMGPRKLTECPVKRGHFKRKGSSSKHYFSGDMLVFAGVFVL